MHNTILQVGTTNKDQTDKVEKIDNVVKCFQKYFSGVTQNRSYTITQGFSKSNYTKYKQ